MVSRITYRPFIEDDFDELSTIVREAWYRDFPAPELGELAAKNDLARMLAISSFSQVALVDGTPRGIVLACSSSTRTCANRRWSMIASNYLRRMREINQKAADAYWTSIKLTDSKYETLVQKSNLAHATEISLLAVSPQSQGMGLGSVLIDAAATHVADEGGSRAFLYTDTDCDWKFYENRGFKRMGTYRSTREERRILPKEIYTYGLNLGA